MKQVAVIFKKSFKCSYKILICTLLAGFVMCLIYNAMAGMYSTEYEGVPIGFYPHEETAVTDDLRSYLSDELGMVLTESTDIDYLNTELVDRHIAGIIEIPEGFEAALLAGTATPLEISFLDDYANAAFVRGYLESYTQSVATLASGANGSAQQLASMLAQLKNETASVTTHQADATLQLVSTQQNAFGQVMGFYCMFAFFVAFTLTNQLFDDRKFGLYNRMRATSLRTVQYILGTCSIGLLGSLLLIAPFFVYMAILQPATGMHIWQALIFCIVFSLFVIAFAIVVSLFVNTKNAMTAALIGTATITSMLGGAYFPIDTAPMFMRQVAKITPQYWLTDAIRTLQKDPSAPWLLNIVVIALFGVLFFIIAGIRFVHSGKISKAV